MIIEFFKINNVLKNKTFLFSIGKALKVLNILRNKLNIKRKKLNIF